MAALIKVLLADPEILLLDEPTKGMDREHSRKFGELLRKLTDQGKTYLSYRMIWNFVLSMLTSVEMMFDGKIEGIDEPSSFCTKLFLYDRMCKDYERF